MRRSASAAKGRAGINPTPLLMILVALCSTALAGGPVIVVTSESPSSVEQLAAKETARYLYLRTGHLPGVQSVAQAPPPAVDQILILRKDHPGTGALGKDLAAQQYRLKTVTEGGRRKLMIVGGDDAGLLFGVYGFLEKLGIRFYLHRDVVPDERMEMKLPDIDEMGQPLFQRRGFNPWGGHAEGIDAWNADEWKAVLLQMTKMRMNTILVHAYPWEPSLWAGPPEDVEPDGRVRRAGRVFYFNTAKGTLWGVRPKKTSTYRYGGSLLFEGDDWGPELMAGHFPEATRPEDCVEVYHRAGAMFKDAFTFAHRLGMKVGMGGELGQAYGIVLNSGGAAPIGADTDLNTLPPNPAMEKRYEGIFTRLSRVHPIDFFMLFTQETDYWQGGPFNRAKFNSRVAEWKSALAVWERMKPPFELAAGGWTLGPAYDRAAFDLALPKHVTLSEFSRAYNGPVDEAFARIHGRGKWEIAWCEEDTAFLAPQLWCGRIRKDAADALAYRCNGLLGLYWRSSHVEPMADALARACWDQKPWNPEADQPNPKAPRSTFYVQGPLSLQNNRWIYGYDPNATPKTDVGEKPIAGTPEPALYRTCRHDLLGYRLKVPNGRHQVTLKFCDTAFHEKGQRVFDVALQGTTALEGLDIVARAGAMAACDISFENVAVSNQWLVIDFTARIGKPCLSAIEVKDQDRVIARIRCGGPNYKDWTGDVVESTPRALFAEPPNLFEPRGLPVTDHYADWAKANFGLAGIGQLLADMDGRMPLLTFGEMFHVAHDMRPWSAVEREYQFVEELERFRSALTGAGARQRFEVWSSLFKYARAAARAQCLLGEITKQIDAAKKVADVAQRKQRLRAEGLPLLAEMTRNMGEAYAFLLDSVVDLGGMQTIIDLEARTGLLDLDQAVSEVEKLLGEPLPAECMPPAVYQGKPRIIVPTVRSVLEKEEPLRLKVIILDRQAPKTATLHWRPLGKGPFQAVELRHLGRAVYTVALASPGVDFEYYIQARTASGQAITWPAQSPEINQTIVVWKNSK